MSNGTQVALIYVKQSEAGLKGQGHIKKLADDKKWNHRCMTQGDWTWILEKTSLL